MIGGAVVPLPQKTVKSLADTRQLCAGRTCETIFEFGGRHASIPPSSLRIAPRVADVDDCGG
jgi:hypothetical protein